MPGKPLAERITRPRSYSPDRERGLDRYVPGRRDSRSPRPARRNPRNGGGRRPGARREAEGQQDPPSRARDGRPKKTQEELDAEMAEYFTGGSAPAAPAEDTAAAGQGGDDVDMIE